MAKYSSEQSVLDVIATASDAIGAGAARITVLEQESAELRKKLQGARDDALRAEVALAGLHAALTRIATCPCPISDADCGLCVSCVARAALGVEASNERMINRKNFEHWRKKP